MTSALNSIFQQTWENGFQVFSTAKKMGKHTPSNYVYSVDTLPCMKKNIQMNSADLGMITLKGGDLPTVEQLVLKDFTEHKSIEEITNAEKIT